MRYFFILVLSLNFLYMNSQDNLPFYEISNYPEGRLVNGPIVSAQYLTSIFILGHKENILDVILDPYLFAIIFMFFYCNCVEIIGRH